MDISRVKQILSSEDEVSVHCHGVPVWLQSIDEKSGMAVVQPRGNHDHSRLVAIDSLEET
ncbi:H-type small acid-soluble spore protein [Bacillus sp. T33-2]|uniref:H-type small acid-soluble spore protein n=1 Tax=Bacillus sp. T33-2 TaxID=2054168 RepID=UPI000C790463|nr:H-type small acid-soluble spore protein [Bacillus sp. T33-2]PLR98417.1 H-type small acid-soluble spore protein [Bacillus sp. T33-2]